MRIAQSILKIHGHHILFFLFILMYFVPSSVYSSEVFTDSIRKQDTVIVAKSMSYQVAPDLYYVFERPKMFHFAKAIPSDISSYCKITFRKENLMKVAYMIAGTAVLVVFDQPITDGAKSLGRSLNIAPTNNQKTFLDLSFSIGSTKIPLPLNGPYDLNSSLYFLGDGITHFSIAGGFWAFGLIKKDNRALQTASQLTESILAAGLAVQFLKHITGRESPFTATTPGGLWRVFPNQFIYSTHVPHYDAFPSGHIATAMATVTVIAANYPEYKFIRPLGYTCMGLLTFAMLNNGVHWASDYPLGLAMGYVFAKIAVDRGRTVIDKGKTKQSFHNFNWLKSAQITPAYSGQTLGCQMSWSF